MTFASPFSRVIQRPFGGVPSSAPAVSWWLSGDISAANCVVAYAAKGAASYAASLVNLNAPGTNDVTEVVGATPGWGSATGWTFNGTDQILKTVNDNVCVLIRFSTSVYDEIMLFGVTGPRDAYIKRKTATQWIITNYETGAKVFVSSAASGVVGYSGTKAFMDGSVLTDTTLTSNSLAYPCGIGCCLTTAGAVYLKRWSGNIQAVAIYNTAITDARVLAVSTAMNAL